jgi:rubrerythrin
MPKSLKGTKTEKNLLAAFAGESQARNRYTFFASKARDEGLMQISSIFLETADNEKEHGKRFFKFLEGGDVEITATYPAGIIGETKDNLQAAAAGENLEHTKLYPESAKVAEEEGFPEVAASFKMIAMVEKQHEKRFLGFRENILKGRVFKREKSVKWKCANCGYIHEGLEAPKMCPSCQHKQEYFELLVENW